MKYLAFALIGAIAAQKQCNRENSKPCSDGWVWNEDACACFTLTKCKMMCPEGQILSEIEMCRCIDQCEYDELFTDETICAHDGKDKPITNGDHVQKAMTSRKLADNDAKEGETCDGFNESTGKPFPHCEAGLTCKVTQEVCIPGACHTCVKND